MTPSPAFESYRIARGAFLDELDKLTPMRRRGDYRELALQHVVLLRRFGVAQPMTLDAVANELGVSRERVRKLEFDALATIAEWGK